MLKKVAVFGNAGGGKSTFSQRLSEITGLPLHILDKLKAQLRDEDYKCVHQQIILTDQWIIDGFGCMETVWLRLNQADTLVFIDLPLYVHFWWVTKRLLLGYFRPPAGWPENSPIFKTSLSSYRVLWLCHKYLTPKYREYIEQAQSTKTIYHIRYTREIPQLLELIENSASPS